MTNMEDGTESVKVPQTELTKKSFSIGFGHWFNPSVARYIYGLLFLVTSILAWLVRDYGHAALADLQRLQGCQGAMDCLGAEGVLRISLGCFIFFLVMFLSTVGTQKLNDRRSSWNCGWWLVKIILWATFMVISFMLPSACVLLYGKIAHLGAGIFLFIQVISVISLIKWLNDWCRTGKNQERCRLQVIIISITTYAVSLVGIIMMYVWYAPRPSCTLNILFITLTLALLQLITFISINPKVQAGFLTPGLMGVYIVFLCWCAIRSEPQSESCNKKAAAATRSDWVTIISFVIALLVIVIATFTTGIDSQTFQFKKAAETEDEVPYGYGFFHFVFAMGATYFAMLFIGWNTHQTMRKWTIDVGWVSAWVRIVNEWLAAIVYIWMLLSPFTWKTKWMTNTT